MDETQSWKTDRWWTSHYNFDPEVTKKFAFQEGIELHDVTLRDGEQTPGVVFTRKEKVEIAMALDGAGVHRIEAGMPAVSEDDREAVKEIVKGVTKSRVFAFCRVRKEDVDASVACGVDAVVLEIPALSQRLKVLGLTVEKAAENAVGVIEYAKGLGLFVVFFPYDTTRTTLDSVMTMARAGEAAHADRLAIVDTVGGASPEGFSHLVRTVRSATKTQLEVHCHNTLGVGVANTIGGLAAGAKCAHLAVNGIGEGAGNVALEEAVFALKLLYGIDCGVNIDRLYELSKVVAERSGIGLAVNKPVFGKNIFRRESGMVVERYYKMPDVARELELMDPAWFAGETEIVLGKKSGKYSILFALRKRGLTATDEQVKEILERVKSVSISKKGLVTESELDEILKNTLAKTGTASPV
ncbi:MAG: hypothetical protein KGI38_02615 [Thaumarchaeota archaeon]|nr:hypothetical protein [Nitrososphaerota archaeon]